MNAYVHLAHAFGGMLDVECHRVAEAACARWRSANPGAPATDAYEAVRATVAEHIATMVATVHTELSPKTWSNGPLKQALARALTHLDDDDPARVFAELVVEHAD